MCLTVDRVLLDERPDRVPAGRPEARAARPRTRVLARLSASALAVTALAVAPAAAPPPSGAASTYLCTGYTGCANAGYSHAGYATKGSTMYWRMYGGHNCTNYAAYRMVQAGMPNVRPWSGDGDATNWGYAMRDITDTTPTVGSIAWWRAGAGGTGSSGHVAYVERVVSATEIVISEDSWSGDFHWRTITKTGTSWPTGFIHFVDKTVQATAAPRIAAVTPQVGVPLRGWIARFTPRGSTHALQWLVDGAAAPGATGNSFTPRPEDAGKVITLRDTGTRDGYSAGVSVSEPTAPVVAGAITRVAKPVLAGEPEVGRVLTVTPAQWSPTPTARSYRWRLDGVWQQELTGTSLTLTQAMVGKTVSVVEVARAPGFTQVANASGEVGPVVAGTIELSEPFRASGAARNGDQLTFTRGTWSPRDARVSFEWLRDGSVVPGATAATYPLTDADVGRRITVRATVSKPRYDAIVRTADYGTVTSPSTIGGYTGGRRLGAVARVQITAPGVAAPTGVIWARVGETVARGTVVDGYAELKLEGLKPGRHKMVVLYDGDGVAERAITTRWVTVKRKRG
jgi:surface antigen